MGGDGGGQPLAKHLLRQARVLSRLDVLDLRPIRKHDVEIRGARARQVEIGCGGIFFRGHSCTGTAADLRVRDGIVHVLEGRHVFPHLTVEENLMSGGFLRRPRRSQLRDGIERVYAWFPRLKTRRKTQAGYTSGGEQQMIAIGRALMTNPSLVLLDEPSMGLAPLIVEEIFEIVSQLNKAEKVSFLVAEQNIPLALAHADCGYVLDTGKVVLSGSAKDLRSNDAVRDIYLGKKPVAVDA